MTKNKLNVGIVGLGSMGRNHVRIASSHQLIKDTWILDLDLTRVKNVAAEFECNESSDYDELLDKVDVVIIATATLAHYQIAKKALEKGKHCLIEKPITASVEEAKSLIEIAKAKNLTISVGHVERYNPVFSELTKILQNEEILTVHAQRLSYNLSRANDVSVILDLMIHDIDTICELSSSSLTVENAIGGAYRSIEADYVAASLVNADKVAFSLAASKISQTRVRLLNITCVDCFIDVDYLRKEIQIFRHSSGKYLNRFETVGYRQEALVERVMVPGDEPLTKEQSDFYESVLEGRRPLVTGEHGMRALELATQIELALRS